jgi:hypothetical protein
MPCKQAHKQLNQSQCSARYKNIIQSKCLRAVNQTYHSPIVPISSGIPPINSIVSQSCPHLCVFGSQQKQKSFPICDGCSMLGLPQMDSWIPPMDCDPQNMRLRIESTDSSHNQWISPRNWWWDIFYQHDPQNIILIESSPIIYQLRDCHHFLKVKWWIFP